MCGAARLVPVAVAVLALAGTVSACSSAQLADKAGGTSGSVELRIAISPSGVEDVPALAYFARRVVALSAGRVRLVVVPHWGDFGPDSEASVVHAVSSGTTDLGWVGSRVFDSLGVRAFQAVSAPLLVDSYPLEEAVVSGPLPARMLTSLNSLGVVGLAVAADSLRQPFSAHRPLLAPTDWAGVRFGTYRSTTQEATIRALGATPVLASGPFRLDALQTGTITAFELDVPRDVRLGLETQAPLAVRNVTLWPQLDVLIANPHQLSKLDGRQRGWLTRAAADTVARSVGLAKPVAAELGLACTHGLRFVTASAAELAALRAAVAPVYVELRRDSETARYLDDIARIKATLTPPVPPPLPPECPAASPG